MPRGRKPKPAEQRIAEGNLGKRAIPKPARVGDVVENVPRAPAHLSTAAREAWGTLAPIVTRAGLLRSGDMDAFEALCDSIGVRRMAAAELKAYHENHSTLLLDGHRGSVAHPCIAIERAAAGEVRKWCERFGLDPSSRTRLGAGGEEGTGEPEDDLPELAELFAIDGGNPA